MKRFILSLFFLYFSHLGYCQSNLSKTNWESRIRNHPDFNFDPNLQQELLLKLEYLSQHPISINHTTLNELMEIPFVDLIDAQAIIQHIQKHGKFLCLEELMAVEEFSSEKAKWIANFVHVEKNIIHNIDYHQITKETKFELQISRISSSRMKLDFPQLAFHDLVKMRCQVSNSWQFGFSLENDAGENYLSLKNGLFDFQSFFLQYKANTKLKTICFGDYRMHYGQGLAMGLGFAPGKGAQVLNAIRFNNGLNKFSSFDENRFFRGIAFSYDFKLFDLDVFYSFKRRDASLLNDSILIGNVIESGYHRSSQELANRNSIAEEMFGFRTQFKIRKLSLGLLCLKRNLNPNIEPVKSKFYQFWNASSSNYLLGSIDAKLNYQNCLFSSELAIDVNKAHAFQLCGIAAIHQKLDLVFLLRDYAKNYVNPYANGMCEWSNQNEKGMYVGFVYKQNKSLSLSFYADYYFSDWLRYRFPSLKWGFDQFAELKYEQKSGLKTSFRIRKILGEEFVNEKIVSSSKLNFRGQLQFKFLENFELLSRWELLTNSNQTNANLFAEELEWKSKKLSIHLRHTIFNAEKDAGMLYATESDLSGIFGLNSYNGNGYSSYILMQSNSWKGIKLGTKISFTQSDRNLEGDLEWKIQMKISI